MPGRRRGATVAERDRGVRVTTAMRSLLGRFDRWQRRRRWTAVIVGVGRKYSEDGAARDGARIAYYAFFSVFPLMLAFVSILGFVLDDRPGLRQDILDSVYADMAVIGPLIRDDIGSIRGGRCAPAPGLPLVLSGPRGGTGAPAPAP